MLQAHADPFPASPIRATAEFMYGVHKHEARIRLALGCHNGGLVGAVGGPVDGEERLPKRPRVSRKLQPLVAAWPKRPSRTVASLLGYGPGFSASPSPAMGPTHYGEVSATHRGKVSSVILSPAIHPTSWKGRSPKFVYSVLHKPSISVRDGHSASLGRRWPTTTYGRDA